MKKVFEFLRFFFISFEFVIILLSVIIYKFFRVHVVVVSDLITQKNDVIKHVSLVPSGIAVWVFIKGKGLLFPEKDKKEILQNWPDYWILKIGFEVTLIYSCLFALIGLFGWAADWTAGNPVPFLMVVTALIGAAVVFYTVYKAQIKINELFIQGNDVN